MSHVRYEQDGPVVLITIDRPERMNAIGPRTHTELVKAWRRLSRRRRRARRGADRRGDRAFSAGGDLKASFVEGEPTVSLDPEERAAHTRGEREATWARHAGRTCKPTIAAVNGVAYAGGLEWVCWTDLAVADAHATFGVTQALERRPGRRRNAAPAANRGYRRAMELILTGRVIDADEALTIGLVNEVVPSGTCVERSLALARELAALPQPAIHTDHEAVARGWGELAEGLRIEAECFDRLLDTPEILEGLRRFNERDHPDRAPGGGTLTAGLRRG